jgi:phage terminase large subunit-like protein
MGVRKRRLTRGQRVCEWIEQFCRIPEGKFVGKPVVLRPWQRKIIRDIYDSSTRRGIISFGRKNAKTTLSAFLLLAHLCGSEARPNSQLFSAAQSRDQAAVLFALAAKIVRMSPDLRQAVVIRDTAKQLFCPDLGTLYRALSAEASTAHGLSPVFVVHDELGQVRGPRSDLYEALETAAGAQEDPLSIVISTQAPDDGDLLSILIDDAKTGADPKVKLFLYTAPEELDPFSDEAIRLANPAYGDFLNAEEVRGQAESARRMPSRENAYRNLVLNQRISAHSPFVSKGVWDRCSGEPDYEVLRTSRVWIGLDLSARNDLTALVSVAQDGEGTWHVFPEFFAPLIGLMDRSYRDRVPYDVWSREGLLTATPGASVDYAVVAQRLVTLCDDYDVAGIGFDRWRIDVLQHELADLGRELPLIPFGQGYRDMSPAIDAVESELMNGRVRHGRHPILTSCVANAVTTRDPAGNRKLDKSKVSGRIDGAVALAIAIGSAEKSLGQTFIVTSDYELTVV